MRHRDADQLKYKITLPLLLLLSLSAIYLFHSIIVENRNFNELYDTMHELEITANSIAGGYSSDRYNTAKLESIIDEIENYPVNERFALIVRDHISELVPAVESLIDSAKTDDNSRTKDSLKRVDSVMLKIQEGLHREFNTRSHIKIKFEYSLLMLIILCAIVHYFLVDKPMRHELWQNAREKEASKATLRRLAERDTLTNLPGRMKFHEESQREIAAATRYGSDLVLIKIDIHKFKDINLKFGQQAGDKILAAFARTMRKNLRRPDSLFRVGGDKFMILAPHTNTANAKSLAEKIIQLVETTRALRQTPFSINTGIASCEKEDTAEDMLQKVDHALAESKKYGPGAIYTYPLTTEPE